MSRIETLLAHAGECAVLLDLDGTLAPIVEHPEDVRIPTEIRKSLHRLVSRYRLVAFISGRAMEQLRTIVAVPGAAYSGNHGVEIRLADGRTLPVAEAHAAMSTLREFADGWSPHDLAPWGVWLEDKGATLTFHYRTAPDPARAAAFLEASVACQARTLGLVAESGRMSLEIHPAGQVNKGTAVRALLGVDSGIRHAVSIGDDRTDVTIWRELRRLVSEARLDDALAIGVHSEESPPEVLAEADALVEGVTGAGSVLALLAG